MTLAVIGAILLLAVRKESPVIDVQVVGLILLVAGAGLIWNARRGRERVVTTVEDDGDPETPAHTTTRRIVEHDD